MTTADKIMSTPPVPLARTAAPLSSRWSSWERWTFLPVTTCTPKQAGTTLGKRIAAINSGDDAQGFPCGRPISAGGLGFAACTCEGFLGEYSSGTLADIFDRICAICLCRSYWSVLQLSAGKYYSGLLGLLWRPAHGRHRERQRFWARQESTHAPATVCYWLLQPKLKFRTSSAEETSKGAPTARLLPTNIVSRLHVSPGYDVSNFQMKKTWEHTFESYTLHRFAGVVGIWGGEMDLVEPPQNGETVKSKSTTSFGSCLKTSAHLYIGSEDLSPPTNSMKC